MNNNLEALNTIVSNSGLQTISYYGYFAIAIVSALLVSAIVYFYYTGASIRTLFTRNNGGGGTPVQLPIGGSAPGPLPPSFTKESWCFVGEDFTGRWCVNVPSERSCDAERTFGSRSECEMVGANALPAGVIKNNGQGTRQLASMSIL